jgi:hypothetical protein
MSMIDEPIMIIILSFAAGDIVTPTRIEAKPG